jgi:ribosomal-protein-serine acetyltransferase
MKTSSRPGLGQTDAMPCRFELSEGCALRLLEESDAHEVHALVEANRAHLSPWLPWAAQQLTSDTVRYVEASRRRLAAGDGIQTVIELEGAIVGLVGFHGVDWDNRKTSLGYWLDAHHQGRGIMTRAVGRLVEHAFDAWRLNRIEIQVAPGNHRSRAVPRRLGFAEEGTLREAERVRGRYLDIVVYSLLAREWETALPQTKSNN